MKRILTGIVLMVLCCVGFAGSSMAYDKDPSTCDHHYAYDITYEQYDENSHVATSRCRGCGTIMGTSIEEHPYYDVYEFKDNENHCKYNKCARCGYKKLIQTETHYGIREDDSIHKYNEETHTVLYKCFRCEAEYMKYEEHNVPSLTYEYIDENTHKATGTCNYCKSEIVQTKEHYDANSDEDEYDYDYEDDDNIYISLGRKEHTLNHKCAYCNGPIYIRRQEHDFKTAYERMNGKYHREIKTCKACKETVTIDNIKHKWKFSEVIKKATPTSEGKVEDYCTDCRTTRERKVSFGDKDASTDYEVVTFSPIFRTSKSVTVKLNRPLKGGTVQVKIGKKTYKSKIKNNSKKIKVKIKNPKMGQKVTVQLLYKNKVLYSGIGEDNDDDNWVYYAKKIKKGMTMKQVKYTYEWGPTDDTASSSGGWKFWHYDDYSSVSFKNGRVVSWYDAAG